MKRRAYTMKLKKGFEEEYKKRHDAIWPELCEDITQAGISDYSIFLDETTGTLFAVQKMADDQKTLDRSISPIVQKWWNYMADIMETHPNNAPVQIPLREVFHLD